MILFIVVLVIVLLGLLFMTELFLEMILEFLINLPILLFIYYRAKIDVLKKKAGLEYLAGLVLGGIIAILLYPFVKGIIIWPITIWIIITFMMAKIMMRQKLIRHGHERKRKMHVARRARKPGTLRRI